MLWTWLLRCRCSSTVWSRSTASMAAWIMDASILMASSQAVASVLISTVPAAPRLCITTTALATDLACLNVPLLARIAK
jgi:hypothetical protein